MPKPLTFEAKKISKLTPITISGRMRGMKLTAWIYFFEKNLYQFRPMAPSVPITVETVAADRPMMRLFSTLAQSSRESENS